MGLAGGLAQGLRLGLAGRARASLPHLPAALRSYAFGVSVRQLTPGYSGPCVRIRRSSDNATSDFGFSSGIVDVPAITAFVGEGTPYITRWYAQDGSGNYADATTDADFQPVLSSENGQPTVLFNGTSNWFNVSSYSTVFKNKSWMSCAAVALDNASSNNGSIIHVNAGSGTITNFRFALRILSGAFRVLGRKEDAGSSQGVTAALNGGVLQALHGYIDMTNEVIGIRQGNASPVEAAWTLGAGATDDTASTAIEIGRLPSGTYYNGKISEVVLYNDDISNLSAQLLQSQSFFLS